MEKQTLDCLGKNCPIPVVEAKKALAKMTEGEWLEVRVDGNTQVQNLERLAKNLGSEVSSQPEDDHFLVTIQKAANASKEMGQSAAAQGKTLVIFSAEHMGEGDEELGKILMKSCVFSITQLDPLPDRLIFYNGGVKLTTAGSPVLEDLQNLETAGVEIFSCGTCLKHLGLEKDLKVGMVSNMYEILEMQMQAGRIIRP